MLDHIGLRTNRLKEMFAFYEAVLAPLGYAKQKDFGVAAGFGLEHHPQLLALPKDPAHPRSIWPSPQ